MNFSIDIGVE